MTRCQRCKVTIINNQPYITNCRLVEETSLQTLLNTWTLKGDVLFICPKCGTSNKRTIELYLGDDLMKEMILKEYERTIDYEDEYNK